MIQHYTDVRDIAFAEMVAVLKGLIWTITSQLQQPTTITLFTDFSVVYYSLVKGTGLTLRASPLLQNMYVGMLLLKNKAGHGLVVRWIPSEQKLADPLSRGEHAYPDSQP
jgi:hypothetical protein